MSELDQNDALAAEYVLGTLDTHERALARTLLTDEGFAAKVRLWERRLGELHLMVEPVEPDAQIWPRIKTRMYEPPPDPNARLPEPQNLEPPPAPMAMPGADPPPSLEAIEAVISDATMTLNAEASPAQKSEQVPERPPDAEMTATSEPIPAPMEEEVVPPPASEPAPALAPEPSSEAATRPPSTEPSAEPVLPPPLEPSAEPTAAAAAPSEPSSEPGLPPPLESPPATVTEPAETTVTEPAETTVTEPAETSVTEPAETGVTEPVETAVVHAAEVPPEPSALEPATTLPPAPSIPAPTPPPPVVAPPPVLDERLAAPVEPQRATMRVHRRLRRWRAFALLLTLIVAVLAALLAAWRFAPDRVPPPLQPLALMRHFGVAPPAPPQLRRPLPPGSQYDE